VGKYKNEQADVIHTGGNYANDDDLEIEPPVDDD
jgi:hypothetical protein